MLSGCSHSFVCVCVLSFLSVVQLTYTGLSTWLWFLYGVASNDLVMPRKEHRVMSARLDKIRLKPKEQTRRQTEEENQLEKMLGYN